ncbi:MAG: ABC transporter permease [bacterium]|nr:ABC transporter permease [bacterium]
MLKYILRRCLFMIPTLVVVSIISFVVIQLPPGDYLSSYIARLEDMGTTVDDTAIQALKAQYGLDQPFYIQYWKWMSGILIRGDFGYSFTWNRPVSELIWSRLGMTLILSVSTLFFLWVVSFPIGVYSAVKQYSFGDYLATFIGFIGLAVPNFLLALVLMYTAFAVFNQSVGGLFSPDYLEAAWSWAKVVDLLKHLWIPVIVLGTAGTAGLIRIMRANLLDELSKPYVEAARSRGLSETRLLLKYPVRVALNPFVSTIGWTLPGLISGATVTAIVLSLPTTGPLLIQALMTQDMYLAGSFILLLSSLTVIGTLISDILLAALDPRIRYH